MIRTAILRHLGGYSAAYPNCCEDYELVRRIARVAKLANLPDYLTDYTFSPRGISLTRRRKVSRARLRIQWAFRDFASIHFYLGILKTLALRPLPLEVLTALKKRRKDYRARAA